MSGKGADWLAQSCWLNFEAQVALYITGCGSLKMIVDFCAFWFNPISIAVLSDPETFATFSVEEIQHQDYKSYNIMTCTSIQVAYGSVFAEKSIDRVH